MKKSILFLCLIAVSNAYSQNYFWGRNLNHEGNCTTILPNGDIVVFGAPGISGNTSMSKFDQSGDLLWTKTFGGANWSFNVHSDSLYNIYLSANIKNQSGTIDIEPGDAVMNYTHTGNSLLVAKLDSAGNSIWTNTYPRGSYSNFPNVNIDVSKTSGKIAVVGAIFGNIDFDLNSTPSGEHTSDQYGNRFVLILDNDGNYLNSWFAQDASGGYETYTTCKFNSNDHIIAGGKSNPGVIQIQEFDLSGSLICNLANDPVGNVSDLIIDAEDHIYAVGEADYHQFIYKLESTNFVFNNLWTKLLPSASAPYWESVKFGPDNSLLIGGQIYSPDLVDLSDDNVLNDTISSYNLWRPVMVRYSNTGDYISNRYMTPSTNNMQFGEIAYFDSTAIMVSKAQSFGFDDLNSEIVGTQSGTGQGTDGFLVKWNFSDLNANTKEFGKSHFQIFPNPARSIVSLSIKQADVIVFKDLNGQTILEIKDYVGSEISLPEFSSGIYFVTVFSKDALSTEKLIVE